MNPTEIEFAVKDLVAQPYNAESFPYDLAAVYNAPKATISKLKSGQTNAATSAGDMLWKKHLFFRSVAKSDDVAAVGDSLAIDPLTRKHKPRFVFVTDGEQVHIRDLKLDDTCNVEFAKLDERSDFLLPLAGFERRATVEEHPADIKAAKRLKKLYDAILGANPEWAAGNHTHELNLFMTRVLFCFYAEDTEIFDTPQIFTDTVTQYTKEDGSDVATFLDRLFQSMNVQESKRPKNTSAVEAKFPYVNGSLFETTVEIPVFNRTARRLLLECGELDWTTINPDIFGSMIQTIAEPGARGDLGMHYTSVPNIMKVLQPLFLDELHDAYEKAKDSVPKLEALLGRLSKIRVFDPACGSGNFLIISYKALRRLEIQVLVRIGEIAPKAPLRLSGISLEHFYGIDLVDFACETAKLSLWIAEHQMNTTFREVFGSAPPTLPLAKIKTIYCGNALRMSWSAVCPLDESAETYVCGNPPYVGTAMQTKEQKLDIERLLVNLPNANANLDYIAGWFCKAHLYLTEALNETRAAFVSTNSLCQGEHVPMLWPTVLSAGIEIIFAHTSFKWSNSATNNAGVSCVIVGIGPTSAEPKRLFIGSTMMNARDISPYLLPFATPFIYKRTSPLSDLPPMVYGSQPVDGSNFIFTPEQRSALLRSHPEAKRYLRKYVGSQEFVKSIERWCLWIPDDSDAKQAAEIPEIKRRLNAIADLRDKGGTRARPYRNVPHRFVLTSHQEGPSLIMPTVTSETRPYLTVGALDSSYVINSLAYAIYQPPEHLLSVLSSKMHTLWATTVGGHLETRMRYSNQYVYNTFPVPELSLEQRRTLAEYTRAILKTRAKHVGKTIAWLYDPQTMPADLLEIHRQNDVYLEECVYGRKFKDDLQRLEALFNMYTRMRESEQREGPLFLSDNRKKAV